ncbi:H transfer determinant A [Klebsiella michiganensis]|nr:H transfer determinant A [Klebsiella michiganensis]
MLSRNSLIHGLRRDQLIGVLTISEFPVVMVESHFIQSEVMGIKPVIFNIDELLVSISPISSLKFDWEWAPVDTILIEVIIPPVESDLVSAENDFLRDSGIYHIQCEPGGASIRRTVTFVGGITADNLLYQLRLMCVSALKLLGEELGDEV